MKIKNEMNKIILLCYLTFCFSVVLFAQNKSEQINIARQKIEKLSVEQRKYYLQNAHKRIPNNTQRISQLKSGNLPEKQRKNHVGMPANFWIPGEFEEVQAILISWSYYHVRSDIQEFELVEPINDSLALSDEEDFAVPYVSILDTFDYSRLPIISAYLADAIQKGDAQVWINVCNDFDSIAIKKYMSDHGMPLSNYRFFINPNNSIWYRDCGPIGFYHGNDDSLAFLDFEYYVGRAADDKISDGIGREMNIPVFQSNIKYEGGNLLYDGAGSLFTSDEIYNSNKANYGQIYIGANNEVLVSNRPSLSNAKVRDSLIDILGLSRLTVLPRLKFDGGTGHIDLYAAMWDENNFVFTQFPPALSHFTDYLTTIKNRDTMCNLLSYHGQKYRGRNIPLPIKDDETWYESDDDFEEYTRTYSNSTFVNNVIIQPIFSDIHNGNLSRWDSVSLEIMKRNFPGYEIIPIDIRGYEDEQGTGFDGTGGAIHCITKQIPAENPIRILHKSIQDLAQGYNGEFPIEATITNRSSISNAICYWREKGSSSWNSLTMSAMGNNNFSTVISRNPNLAHDTIEYYISATSNNGKTISKPFTAPNGFYTFYHGTADQQAAEEDIYAEMPNVGIIENNNSLLISMGNFYPNPTNQTARILINNTESETLVVNLYNLAGQCLMNTLLDVQQGETLFEVNCGNLANGIYFVQFNNQKGNCITKKLVVQQ